MSAPIPTALRYSRMFPGGPRHPHPHPHLHPAARWPWDCSLHPPPPFQPSKAFGVLQLPPDNFKSKTPASRRETPHPAQLPHQQPTRPRCPLAQARVYGLVPTRAPLAFYPDSPLWRARAAAPPRLVCRRLPARLQSTSPRLRQRAWGRSNPTEESSRQSHTWKHTWKHNPLKISPTLNPRIFRVKVTNKFEHRCPVPS